MTPILLVGLTVALLATGAAVAYERAPTRVRCPECGTSTKSVVPPLWLRRTAPLLQVRWCPRCSWQGVGRNGPEWVPGRLVAHDSGFHWGMERLPEDFGFQWRPLPHVNPGAPPPHHPSGFRFGETADEGPVAAAAHPSGFAWRLSPESPTGGFAFKASTSGPIFEWRDRQGSPFVWGEPKRSPRSGDFQWKGVA